MSLVIIISNIYASVLFFFIVKIVSPKALFPVEISAQFSVHNFLTMAKPNPEPLLRVVKKRLKYLFL